MATTQTTKIQCDHVSSHSKQQCTTQSLQSDLTPEAPMYHLSLTLTAIDASGTTVVETLEQDVCIWDIYHALSSVHDREKARIVAIKERAAGAARVVAVMQADGEL